MNRTINQLCDDILERLAMMPGTDLGKPECVTDEHLKREKQDGPSEVRS